METELLYAGAVPLLPAQRERITVLLRRGEAVALPTETVYGLAADATNADAIAKIFEAKERPFFDPLIVHLPTMDWLEKVARVPAESRGIVEALLARFWPGPLTLVLPRRDLIPEIVTSGLETIAVRMSSHPLFREVIATFGKPLAAPSANRFGRISPTTAQHVMTELAGRIPLIVDNGSTEHGVESTIVAPAGDTLRLLRPGPISRDELASLAPVIAEPAATSTIEAPGQLPKHYAPGTPLVLLSPGNDDNMNLAATSAKTAQRRGLLAWRDPQTAGAYSRVEVLSPTGDLREAAATLFEKLRRLDQAGLDLLIAEPVPEEGLGVAIMDRLRKAAR